MCPPTFLALSGLLWGLRGGRGERGFGPRWGKRLQSCAPDTPTACGQVSGESRPRRGAHPPASAAPLAQSGDMTALCCVLPFSLIPPEHS